MSLEVIKINFSNNVKDFSDVLFEKHEERLMNTGKIIRESWKSEIIKRTGGLVKIKK